MGFSDTKPKWAQWKVKNSVKKLKRHKIDVKRIKINFLFGRFIYLYKFETQKEKKTKE